MDGNSLVQLEGEVQVEAEVEAEAKAEAEAEAKAESNWKEKEMSQQLPAKERANYSDSVPLHLVRTTVRRSWGSCDALRGPTIDRRRRRRRGLACPLPNSCSRSRSRFRFGARVCLSWHFVTPQKDSRSTSPDTRSGYLTVHYTTLHVCSPVSCSQPQPQPLLTPATAQHKQCLRDYLYRRRHGASVCTSAPPNGNNDNNNHNTNNHNNRRTFHPQVTDMPR